VNDHLLVFAAEWHWTPAQVWDLELWQLVDFARVLDRLMAERKRRSKERGR